MTNIEDKKMNYNGELAFLNLLYKEPLYQFVEHDETDMNVLILGWDAENMSAKFVDQCLQMGQMQNHFLNILIVTEHPNKAKKNYLNSRPALDKFVNVNGSLDEFKTDSSKGNYAGYIYADLNFVQGPSAKDITKDLSESLMDILIEAGKEKYHYFLISYGNDAVNKEIAEGLATVTDELMPVQNRRSIHYVIEGESDETDNGKAFSVCVSSTSSVEEIDENLNRMAFNAHILWESSLNTDYQKAYEKFKEAKNDNKDSKVAYDYSSSIALAVSVRYKLADIGIDWGDFNVTAQQFENMVKEDEGVLNQLIALEHKRWVLERAETGWRPPESTIEEFCEECCERCEVNDRVNHIHPCMVRSTPTPSISETAYYRDKHHWDEENKSDEEHKELDDLDSMSLELHRAMKCKAVEYRNSNPVEDLKESLRYDNIENYSKKVHEFLNSKEWKQYIFCIENILDGNSAYSKQYEYYKQEALKELGFSGDQAQKLCNSMQNSESLNYEEANQIKDKIEELSKAIWPAIQANLYIDYKSNDKTFVRGISFILTYRTNLSLAMPLRLEGASEKPDTIFSNVASAVIIRPKKLIYLLYMDEDRISEFDKTIRNCQRYLSTEGVNCEIKVYVARDPSVDRIKGGNNNYKNIHIINSCVADEYKGAEFLAESLKNEMPDLYDGSRNLFTHIAANGRFYNFIKDKYPYFEFASRDKVFTCDENCRYLTYIKDSTVLSEQEMFTLAGAEETQFDYPFLENPDYCEVLWDIYTGINRRDKEETMHDSVNCWNKLCKNFATFPILQNDLIDKCGGSEGFNKIKPLLEELVDRGILKREEIGSEVEYTCEDQSLATMLPKTGNVLEYCLYYKICQEGWADYVANGVKVKLNDYDVDNELDLVMTKGFRSVVVECKGTESLNQGFYYKLNNVANRLGVNAGKAIVTTARVTDDNFERGDSMHIRTIEVSENLQEAVNKIKELLCT